jgi:serine/threonine-protein kinase
MALPGGDPIAAALAAGETPSPEMVAASGEKEGLQPRTAVACFVAVVLMLVALALLANKTTLLGRAPLPDPPDVMAFKARDMLKEFGYTEEPVDSAYGFFPGPVVLYQDYLRASDFDHRWERLASHQPALTVFWYRQHQDYFQPFFFWSVVRPLMNGVVTHADPPMTSPGMVTVALDAKGRLTYLSALPSSALSQTADGRVVSTRAAN